MDLGLLGPPVVAPEARRRCPSTEPTPRWAYGLASHQTRTVRPRLRAPGGTGPLTRFCSWPPQLGPAQRPAHKFPSRVRRGGRGPGRATQWGQPSRKSASRLVVQVPVVHFVCSSRGNAASPPSPSPPALPCSPSGPWRGRAHGSHPARAVTLVHLSATQLFSLLLSPQHPHSPRTPSHHVTSGGHVPESPSSCLSFSVLSGLG